MKKITLVIIAVVIIATLSASISFGISFLTKEERIDTDGDGVIDKEDDFPYDIAASVDTDCDGYPDDWNDGMDQDDSTTELTIDSFPEDPAASLDTDGDGYPNRWNPGKCQTDSTSSPVLELDEFPNDPNAHKDTDNDGVADYYDINDYVNLAIEVKITKFEVTQKVDLIRWAQIFFEIKIGETEYDINKNNRTWFAWLNQKVTIDHDPIIYDIDDSTKDQFTDIEIAMYDYDIIGSNDLIYISDENSGKPIVQFDNKANKLEGTGEITGRKANIWIEVIPYEVEGPEEEKLIRKYFWRFDNRLWELNLEIPKDLYDSYVTANVKRDPFTNKAMSNFVTSNDPVVKELASELLKLVKEESYTEAEKVNFILKFVQYNVDYQLDEKTKGEIEFWRYPVETLVEKKGDCEDSSVLLASIMDALNYDVALLLYAWEEGNDDKFGHLATGLHLNQFNGDYIVDKVGKKYYYCETTNKAYSVGQIPPNPPELSEQPNRIIYID